MPPGDYSVHLSGGSVRFGGLPALGIPSLGTLQVPVGDQPVPLQLAVPLTFVLPLGSITVTTTITAGQGTLDPTSGAVTIEASFYTKIHAVPGPTLNVSGTCTFGSAGAPIVLHLQTTPESVWKPGTFAFTLYDSSFAVPSPVCDDPSLASLVTNLAGDTSAGHNSVAISGTAARPEDGPPPPPPPPLTSGSGSGSGGGPTPTSATDGTSDAPSTTAQSPTATTPRACVVPRLHGLTLATAKRRLAAANCRLGRVAHRRARRASRGRVIAQRLRPRAHMPVGARVGVTLGKR